MLLDEKSIGVTARSLLEMSSKTGDVAYTDVLATYERYRRDDLPDDRDGGSEQLRVHGSRLMLNASAVKPAEHVEEASGIDNRGALFRGPHALIVFARRCICIIWSALLKLVGNTSNSHQALRLNSRNMRARSSMGAVA